MMSRVFDRTIVRADAIGVTTVRVSDLGAGGDWAAHCLARKENDAFVAAGRDRFVVGKKFIRLTLIAEALFITTTTKSVDHLLR